MTHRAATLAATALIAGLAGLPGSAEAQSAPPARDAASIWTILGENASISSAKTTDRYYTNGLRIGWTSPEGAVPDVIDHVGRLLWGKGEQRISVDISQQMYTPQNTASRTLVPGDRPYAGTLIADGSLLQDERNLRSLLGVGIGVMGPASLAADVQNGFHDLIGQKHDNGWSTQLKNEPVLQFTSERTWRLAMGKLGALETDALPDLTAEFGTLRMFAQTGARIRIGQGLESDYGPARLRPGQTGSDAYNPTVPLAWYVFAGADGRAVARDGTLQGNLYQASPSVPKTGFVGEIEAGAAVMYKGIRLSYVHVLETNEFKHQKGGLHQFGSVNLGARF